MMSAAVTLITVKDRIIEKINLIPQLLVALALVYFLYGVFQYVASSSDEKKLREARSVIFNGLLGLVVMLSVWGIVDVVADALSITVGS